MKLTLLIALPASLLLACGGNQSPDDTDQEMTPSANEATEHAGHVPGDHGQGGHNGHDGHAGHAHGDGDEFDWELSHGVDPDERAEWLAQWSRDDRDAYQQPLAVIALMDIQPGHVAVDVGCGEGYFLPFLSAAVGDDGHVVGLDVSEEAIAEAAALVESAELGNVELLLAYEGATGLPDARVDRVLIVDVWHHIADRPTYAEDLARILAPGGTVTVLETNENAYWPPPAMRMTREQVVAEFEAEGFDVELIDGELPMHFVVRATLPTP